jgi:hypothetical protein
MRLRSGVTLKALADKKIRDGTNSSPVQPWQTGFYGQWIKRRLDL